MMELFRCNCDKTECPVYHKCCFLPTEYYKSAEGKVDILFVGQGGGSEEREERRPFIGKAGKRLRALVEGHVSFKIKRSFGYAISNSIRDNPDENRVPQDDELRCCLPYLYEDIKKLKALGLKCVIPLGNASTRALIKCCRSPMEKVHGQIYEVDNPVFGTVQMMPTYHPSYLCRVHQKLYPEKVWTEEFHVKFLNDLIKALNLENILDVSDIEITV